MDSVTGASPRQLARIAGALYLINIVGGAFAIGFVRAALFTPDLATGPLIVRRGSWDLLPDGSCCTPKRWVSVDAGQFTIQAKGMPDQGYFQENQPGRD